MTLTTLMNEADRRVALSAAWLDENYPNWERKVDPGRLNAANTDDCPLGQLYGSYFDAPREARRLNDWRNGFITDFLYGPSYRELTAAWRRLLLARGVTERRSWGRRLWAALTRH